MTTSLSFFCLVAIVLAILPNPTYSCDSCFQKYQHTFLTSESSCVVLRKGSKKLAQAQGSTHYTTCRPASRLPQLVARVPAPVGTAVCQSVKSCRSRPSWSKFSFGTAIWSYHRSPAALTSVVKQTRPPVLNTGTTRFDERGFCPRRSLLHTRVIDQLRFWLGRIRLRHIHGRGWAGNGDITTLFFFSG